MLMSSVVTKQEQTRYNNKYRLYAAEIKKDQLIVASFIDKRDIPSDDVDDVVLTFVWSLPIMMTY